MSLHALNGVAIKGIASCVPADEYDISRYEYFNAKEASDFIKHVGARYKRWSKGKLTTADLCYDATRHLISQLDWNKEEIGVIVLVTQTPDYSVPASSIILQGRLGLSTSAIAFDVNLGCSGWIYGLSVVGGIMAALNIKRGLLLAGETCVNNDYTDKKTFPLMGEAGSATALEISDHSSMVFDLNTNGLGYQAIIAPESGARAYTENPGFISNTYVKLDSQKVLEFCLKEVTPSINRIMAETKKSVQDIDYFVFHQANKIINDSLRRKITIPTEKFPYSIGNYGNTSSASIPLTISAQLVDKLQHKHVAFICAGFGVGLSWGTVFFEAYNLLCLPVIEV